MGLAFGLCAHALKLHAANPSGHRQDEARRMGERWGERGTRVASGGGPLAALVERKAPSVCLSSSALFITT